MPNYDGTGPLGTGPRMGRGRGRSKRGRPEKNSYREEEIAMDRIAISIVPNDKSLNDLMDDRFGRAEMFLVVDGDTGEAVETIDNAAVHASHGAGTGTANVLKSAGVGAVISGRFGPNAFDALRALGIEAWVAPHGITAGEAFRLLGDGALEAMQSKADR